MIYSVLKLFFLSKNNQWQVLVSVKTPNQVGDWQYNAGLGLKGITTVPFSSSGIFKYFISCGL